MSLQSERIQLLMQRLSLTEMLHGYEALAEQAAQKNLPYCDFLEQVLESEANVRQERNIKVRTQLAGFPDLKRLEQFDFKFPSSIDEKKIRELASLRFLERHENAVFLGPPGVGKTHLAVSLGMEAIRQGFSVYFVSLPDLLDRLVQAQAENRMRRKMSHLRKCRLLILDEIGYRSLDRQATTCLFQLISERLLAGGAMLSDAAFKLYVFPCLNVDRHSARMVWEAGELADLLQCDRPSVTDALEELCRREVCIRHPDADGRIAADRLSIEICDRFWPYEKQPIEEFGIDQNRYVQRVRQMLSGTACMRIHFSAADERLAAAFYRRGVTLVHLQRAIWLGCARKYVAYLNGSENAPMLITSLKYFANLVEEVTQTLVSEDYWKHMQSKVAQLEGMWRSQTARDEIRETK